MIFGKDPNSLNPINCICHSGGAIGSDTIFEQLCTKVGIKVNAYSYKTKSHISPNKVEINLEDYNEGIQKVHEANKFLKRWGIERYMKLLARNWSQVKYSDQIFAIGTINKNIVGGGTGWAVMMGILNNKEVFVFDQNLNEWFKYENSKFIKIISPRISKCNFAGIGTREINKDGINAIEQLIRNSF